MILVDSNVIIDIIEGDSRWETWSAAQIANAGVNDKAVVNEIVVAEVAPSMGSLGAFYEAITLLDIGFEQIGDEAAFLAGTAFLTYRKRRDSTRSIIADFLIGGHALVLGASILTRDPRFYETYFPAVPIIKPSKDDHD